MIKSLTTFFYGLYKMGFGVMMWLGVLVIFNGVLPLYLWTHFEAKITLVVFIIAFLSMIIITHFAGFTRLLGLGHFVWIPLVIYFLIVIDLNRLDTSLNQWMAGLILFNSISLFIDITDVVKYCRGDKEPLLEGLNTPLKSTIYLADKNLQIRKNTQNLIPF